MNFEESLSNIIKTLTNLGEGNSEVIRTLEHFKNGNESKTLNNVVESITKFGTAAEMLAEGEEIDIFAGILTILSGASLFIPGGGPIIGALLSSASSFISAFCSSKGNAGCVVENSIMLVLKKFNDSELEAKSVGTVYAYRMSVAFLNGIKQINKDEVSAVMSSVPILYGVEFLGILKYKIEDNIKSKDTDNILRAIEYTKAYTELSILRSGVLLKLKSIISTVSPNIAAGIQSIMDAEKKVDQQFLKNFVIQTPSRAVFLAYLRPSTLPTVLVYLQHLRISLKLSDLKHKNSISFHMPSLNTTFGLTRPWISSPKMSYWYREKKSSNVEYSFQLHKISERDSIFYILSEKTPQLYVYMSDESDKQCYAKEEKPGREGKWKITQFENGYYMLSTMKWPDWFLDGRIDRCKPNRNLPVSLNIKLKGFQFKSSFFELRKDDDDDSNDENEDVDDDNEDDDDDDNDDDDNDEDD